MRPLNRRGAIRKPESSRLLDYRTVKSHILVKFIFLFHSIEEEV